MNQAELSANPQLASSAVRDLNDNPSLEGIEGCEDGSVDAVICSVSIDYLIKPRAILGEIARVDIFFSIRSSNEPF